MSDQETRALARKAGEGDLAAARRLVAMLEREQSARQPEPQPETSSRHSSRAAPRKGRCEAVKKNGNRCEMRSGLGVVRANSKPWRAAILCPGHWKNSPAEVVEDCAQRHHPGQNCSGVCFRPGRTFAPAAPEGNR